LDRFENIDDDKANFVFDRSTTGKANAKAVGYFWAVTIDLNLWDEIKQTLGTVATTMDCIVQTCIPKKRKEREWNDNVLTVNDMSFLRYKSQSLDTLKSQRIRLNEVYTSTRQKYHEARLQVINHGNKDDEAGEVYNDICTMYKDESDKAKIELDNIDVEITNEKKEIVELELKNKNQNPPVLL